MPAQRLSFARFTHLMLSLALVAACGQKAPDPLPTTLPTGPTAWLTGDANDVMTPTTPGTLLAGGGTDVNEAMRWFLKKSGGGDVVVLRASGSNGYNAYLFSELGETVNSVETLLLNSKEWVNDESVAHKIRNAEALFIAGGDQANYVNFWKDSKIQEAINYLINTKKVPVGGTSAGCAVLGQIYYPALKESLTAAEALSDPYHSNLMLGRGDFLNAPFLTNTIIDTHFAERDRQGRLVAFLARMRKDWNLTTGRGIGVDERTAVAIDANGTAQVFGSGMAYFVTPLTSATPEQCEAGKPLTWVANEKALLVKKIHGDAKGSITFNVATWAVTSSGLTALWFTENGVFRETN